MLARIPDAGGTPTASSGKAEAPHAANAGNDRLSTLFTSLYSDLCRLARREMRRTGVFEDLTAGTLVHEAWLDISRRPSLAFQDDNKFLAYAARTMRGLVIDLLRKRHAMKRGGGLVITSLDAHTDSHLAEPHAPDNPELLQNMSEALDELSVLEPELANVVELKFFSGFKLAEIAAMRGVSARTVQRQWVRARLLLYRELKDA